MGVIPPLTDECACHSYVSTIHDGDSGASNFLLATRRALLRDVHLFILDTLRPEMLSSESTAILTLRACQLYAIIALAVHGPGSLARNFCLYPYTNITNDARSRFITHAMSTCYLGCCLRYARWHASLVCHSYVIAHCQQRFRCFSIGRGSVMEMEATTGEVRLGIRRWDGNWTLDSQQRLTLTMGRAKLSLVLLMVISHRFRLSLMRSNEQSVEPATPSESKPVTTAWNFQAALAEVVAVEFWT